MVNNKTRKTRKPIFIFLNILIVISFFMYSTIGIIYAKLCGWDLVNLTQHQLISITFISEIIYLFFILIIFHKSLSRELGIYINKFKHCFTTGLKAWSLGLIVMIISNIIIYKTGLVKQAANEQSVQSLIKTYPYFMLFSTVIFSPIIEEIIFRKCLKNIIKTDYIYIFISGFIFGLIHIISGYAKNPYEILYIIPYGTLGICFAYSYSKTKTIMTPITFHMIHNLCLVSISIITNII